MEQINKYILIVCFVGLGMLNCMAQFKSYEAYRIPTHADSLYADSIPEIELRYNNQNISSQINSSTYRNMSLCFGPELICDQNQNDWLDCFGGNNTDFVQYTPNGSPYGTYRISNNPSNVTNQWCNITGHTSTNPNNMLILDGSINNDLRVWYKAFNLEAGKKYSFDFWTIQNYKKSSFTFNIKDASNTILVTSSWNVNNQNCNWKEHEFIFQPNSSGIYYYEIINVKSNFIGNDFALDDISLKEILPRCPIQPQIVGCYGTFAPETTLPVTNEKSINSTINQSLSACNYCNGSTFHLIISNPQYCVTYSWTGPNGFTATGSDVTVTNASTLHSGVYTVTATGLSGCAIKQASVTINIITITPTISGNKYICPNKNTTLDGGAGYESYAWTKNDDPGFSKNTQTIEIDQTGTYTLTVTKNGCTASTSIVVDDKCPLSYMPYFSLGPCASGNVNSGIIKADIPNHIGGSGTYVFTLYKDEMTNQHFESQCRHFIASNSSGVFNNLPAGDYQVQVCEGNPTYPYQFCLETTIFLQALGQSLGLTTPLYICPGRTTEIQIDPLFVNVIWSNDCNNKLPESEEVVNIYHHIFKPGAGGWHTIVSTTSGGCILNDRVFIYDFNAPPLDLRLLPKVLQTGVTKMEDVWMPDVSTMQWNNAADINAFMMRSRYAQGKSGIYKGLKSYDYLEDRVLTETANDLKQVKTETDGHFNDVPFFNWHHPKFGLTDNTAKWINTNTMTKYNPASFELENKDILDNKSAALYGYGGKLEIAVAGNASYTEIGFENFEEYYNNNFNAIHQLNNQTGNLDIVSKIIAASYYQYKEIEIVDAYYNKALVAIDNNFSCKDNVMSIDVLARSVPRVESDLDKELLSECVEAKIVKSPCENDKTVMFEFDYNKFKNNFPTGDECTYWYGKAFQKMLVNYPVNIAYPISLSNIAHTGKNAVIIAANTGIELPQKNLRLVGGKEYQISAWIRVAGQDESTPSQLIQYINSNKIGIILKMNPGVETPVLHPSGPVINGWQRVYANFKTPEGLDETFLKFTNTVNMYLDDIRIQPANASMQTYVYDPENYKLRAVLDQNNYATLYKYDDEGNLFLVQKETVEGIKTIQLSNSYIHPTVP